MLNVNIHSQCMWTHEPTNVKSQSESQQPPVKVPSTIVNILTGCMSAAKNEYRPVLQYTKPWHNNISVLVRLLCFNLAGVHVKSYCCNDNIYWNQLYRDIHLIDM